ncbi:hypothetical protein AAZX31_11G167800 [Glycine max]
MIVPAICIIFPGNCSFSHCFPPPFCRSLFSSPLSLSLRTMSKPPSAFDALMSGARAAAKKKSQSQPSPKKRKTPPSQNPSNLKTLTPQEPAVKPEEHTVKPEPLNAPPVPSSSKEKTAELKKQVPQLKKKPSDFDPASITAWEKGQPVPFLFLCLVFDIISQESKRIVITDIVCNLLRTVMHCTPEDLVKVVYLSANRIAPAHEGVELGIGEASITKALAEAYGTNEAWIKTQYQKKGDLGLVAKESRSSQPMIMMFKPEVLTIRKVFNTFRLIAKEYGKESQEKKKNHMKALLVSATDCEPQYLIRLLQSKLRIGYAEKTLLAALGQAAVYTEEHSKPPPDIQSPLEEIHYLENGSVEIYSRHAERNTGKFPDVVAAVSRLKKPTVSSLILDCEIVAYDRQTQTIHSFQALSTRARKNVEMEDIKVDVCIFAFDLLYLNGQALLQENLRVRREHLYASFEEEPGFLQFATTITSNDVEEIQKFLDQAVGASCEGLIIKTLNEDATYEPLKRSLNWLKLKKDYMDNIGDSLDLVAIAAFHGRGKRTGVYGAFLLACYDSDNEEFQSICKIGTGFSEAVLEERSSSLRSKVIPKPKAYYRFGESINPDVWFEASEGISLRFPRLLRVRPDKSPEQASSSEQVAEMYNAQKQNHTINQNDDEDDD